MTLVKEWEEWTIEKRKQSLYVFFISALWTVEGCTITSAVDICSHPRLLWICQLFPPPPPLLSIYLGPSIKAVFCSRGSYGVSGLCHSPSSIMDQHREQWGQSFWVFLIKRCLHLMCCRSIDRLDRMLVDDCDDIDEDDTFSLCMYMYVYTHTHTHCHVFIHVYNIHIYICIYMYLYIYMYI